MLKSNFQKIFHYRVTFRSVPGARARKWPPIINENIEKEYHSCSRQVHVRIVTLCRFHWSRPPINVHLQLSQFMTAGRPQKIEGRDFWNTFLKKSWSSFSKIGYLHTESISQVIKCERKKMQSKWMQISTIVGVVTLCCGEKNALYHIAKHFRKTLRKSKSLCIANDTSGFS